MMMLFLIIFYCWLFGHLCVLIKEMTWRLFLSLYNNTMTSSFYFIFIFFFVVVLFGIITVFGLVKNLKYVYWPISYLGKAIKYKTRKKYLVSVFIFHFKILHLGKSHFIAKDRHNIRKHISFKKKIYRKNVEYNIYFIDGIVGSDILCL